MPAVVAQRYPVVVITTVLPKLFWPGSSPWAAGKTSNPWLPRHRLAKPPAVMLTQAIAWSAPAYRQGKTSNENDCLPAGHHLRDRRRDVFRDAGRPIADLHAGLSRRLLAHSYHPCDRGCRGGRRAVRARLDFGPALMTVTFRPAPCAARVRRSARR